MNLTHKLFTPALVLLLALLGVGMNCPPGPDVTHRLQIRRYITSSMTDVRADKILADMAEILQTNDGPGDVACSVGFTRDGNVTPFTTGNGIINSAADFTAVNGLAGDVKIVNQINWCGAIMPNVISCIEPAGNSFLVVRVAGSSEAHLWLHDFGLVKGLPFRNDANAVMGGFGVNNRRVTEAECDVFSSTAALIPVTAK